MVSRSVFPRSLTATVASVLSEPARHPSLNCWSAHSHGMVFVYGRRFRHSPHLTSLRMFLLCRPLGRAQPSPPRTVEEARGHALPAVHPELVLELLLQLQQLHLNPSARHARENDGRSFVRRTIFGKFV